MMINETLRALSRERLALAVSRFAAILLVANTDLQGADPQWHKSLPEAQTTARRTGVPVLVRVGSESCPYCRILEKTMSEDAVATELAKWTLVDLRLETASDEIVPLAVGPIPALRALTPLGRIVASHEGALPAEELLAWLRTARTAVEDTSKADELLLGDGEVDATLAVQLVALFGKREPGIREAALRRLHPHPNTAAVPVVLAFREGSLAMKLTAIDLLESWRAPVTGIDPWQPATITRDRLNALAEWAAARSGSELLPDAAPDRRSIGDSLTRYSTAPDVEADAIRERLARFGRLLLPQVYEALRVAENDHVRERLTHLRYRLVAHDSIALGWPGGLERLSAHDIETRQQAADELALRATAADEQLLLELFSDPAPLVREIALRTLHRVGSNDVTGALLRLLDDPDPNVQAAVLNQLAESPTPEAVPRVAAYVAREKNADLIGHAVRALGAAQGQHAIDTLTELLSHGDWHVRAAAIEALAQKAEPSHFGARAESQDSTTADIYVAILERLKDDDGFVVGRAVQAFAKTDLPIAVEPLVQAARDHPELTTEVINALSYGTKTRAKALPQLQEFCRHELPAVRAAAITALCATSGSGADDGTGELPQLLADSEPAPRIAAAQALNGLLVRELGTLPVAALSYRPVTQSGDDQPVSAALPGNGEEESESAVLDPEEYLDEIRAGKRFPRWAFDLAPALVPLLEAGSAEERIAGAVALAALGHDSRAVPVLLQAADSSPGFVTDIARALSWLRWSDREKLFRRLVERVKDVDTYESIVGELQTSHDARSSSLIWSLLERPDADSRLAIALAPQFLALYTGNSYYFGSNQPTTAQRRFLTGEATKHATIDAQRWERLVALSLLLQIDADKAVELADALAAQLSNPADHAALLQIRLLGETEETASKLAAVAIQAGPDESRAVAVRYLALGSIGIHDVEGLPLTNAYSLHYGGADDAWDPSPPADLSADMLRPLLQSSDAQTVLCARYLLVLLGEEDALPAILDHWKRLPQADDTMAQLVYRAIAAADDPRGVPVLDSLYQKLKPDDQNHKLRDFYWTVRIMTGPEALALRKKIREEIGMENLR